MKSPTVLRFDRTADGYLRWWAPVLEPMSVVLVDRLIEMEPGLATNWHCTVLDVGCGTGNLLFEAARRFPAARLTGLDASDGMLAVAQREQSKLGKAAAGRLSYFSSNAARMPLRDASFDVVATAFMLQQVPDRPAVLREIRRLLRPNGLLGIGAWLDTGYEFQPDLEMELALQDAGIERPPMSEKRAGHYSSVDQAETELREAGFAGVSSLPANLDHPWTADDFVAYRTTTRDVELVETMPPDRRQAFLESLRRRLNSLAPDQLVYRESVVSITARRA